jgi:glucokinase
MTQRQAHSAISVPQNAVAVEETGYVIGIDLGASNLRLALADTSGAVIAKWSSSTVGIRDANAVITLVKNGAESLLQRVSASQHALKAVAAGAPGITDVDAGIVIATSYLLGWRDVPLRTLLEDTFSVPAAVDNDVNLAAIGESWTGAAKGARDFVFLAIGTGIGASIVLNGNSHRGRAWASGEIGYMLVPGTPTIPGNHGEPGALENIIGGEGIKTQWQKLWSANSTSLSKDLTATQIFDHALTGDPLAKTILEQTARMLSYAIYNMTLVLDCPLFVLGGGVGMHQALCDETQNMLGQLNMRSQPQLTRSALGTDAQLMGALRLALDTVGSRSALFASEGIGGK